MASGRLKSNMTLNVVTKCGAVAVLSLMLAACGGNTKPLYYWGSYEGLVHDMYIAPGNAPPAMQIEKINADIEQAAQRGQGVPPGVYAHLGMAYAAQGNAERATAALLKEKSLFPESRGMIDTLIQNQQAGVQ